MSAWNELPSVVNTITNTSISTGPVGSDLIIATAGQALSGHKMVVLDSAGEAIYADNTTMTHIHKVLGMTIGASSIGTDANILTHGKLTEPTWSWTLDLPIFLISNGSLSQTAPTSGFSQVVAFPLSATSVMVDLREPISL